MANTPAVRFFIKNYKDLATGEIVTTDKEFMSIPLGSEVCITNPKVKNEMGKAGSFEFGMELESSLYNVLMQMKTIMRVELFGRTIFRGRVLTIDRTASGTRTVHCEGDFAFLLDTIQPGSKEESRPVITVLEYLTQIIKQHNDNLMGDLDKKIELGEVPGKYSDSVPADQRVTIPEEKAKQKFGETGNNTTMDRLEGLLGDFGGYFRTRFDVNTQTTYLDWLDKYYDPAENTQSVEVSKNLIDISGTTEVENLFTVIIPIGKRESENIYITDYWPIVKSDHTKVNYMTVPELADIPLYSDEELNANYHKKQDYSDAIKRYGIIWKTVDFENANTPEKLFAYCKDWIKQNYMPELTQWSVGALDLRFADGVSQALYCGDQVPLKHPEVDKSFGKYTIISADYDLFNPDKNKYTIGIPNQQVNSAYGVAEKTNKTSASGGKGGGGASGRKPPPSDDDGLTPEERELKAELENQYIYKADVGGDIGLDDPNAYLYYNTDGSKKTEAEVREALIKESEYIIGEINKDPERRNQLMQEARQLGVRWNDPQFLLDHFDGIDSRAAQFRAQTGIYMREHLGLNEQQIAVLLNDSSSTSWLASLVDDEGHWTTYAINHHMNIVSQPDMLKMAVNARNILNGNSNDPARAFSSMLTGNGITGAINSLSERIGNFFNVDGLSFNLDIGNLISEDGSNVVGDILTIFKDKTNGTPVFDWLQGMFTGWVPDPSIAKGVFEFLTENSNINGETGSLGLGKDNSSSSAPADGNKWLVSVNKPLQYRDEKTGDIVTLPGGTINAEDYAAIKSAKPIPSFSSKFAYIDTAVIGALYAENGVFARLSAHDFHFDDLDGDVADIKRLTADYANIRNIVSGTAQATKLWSNTISVTNIDDCMSFEFKGHNIVTRNAVDANGNTIHVLGYWD